MQVGDIVKYREALEPGDEQSRFVVSELRGDRVLVTEFAVTHDMSIKPTYVLDVADLNSGPAHAGALMNYCVHYFLQRENDETPVRHVINDVPGASAEQAEENARQWVESQGHTYVETVRIVDTTN